MERCEIFMRMALSLAMRGTGRASPNPRVGCVITDGHGSVLSYGYHRACGEAHAEADALRRADRDVRGSTVYVTLEPCCHVGRTPPCADALIEAGVARVVVGVVDPDPRASGQGIARLRSTGVEVEVGLLERECRHINRGFFKRVTRGMPLVTAKAAVSLDGAMTPAGGDSRWITSEVSRARAHMMRAEHDAVMVGAGTASRDDPELTVRDAEGLSPKRVLLDGRLTTDPTAKIFRGGAIVLTCDDHDADRARRIEDAGGEIVPLESRDGRVDLEASLRALAARGVNSLMIEGGPGVIGSYMRERLVDEVALFIAPKILGTGARFADWLSLASARDAASLKDVRQTKIGQDILIEGAIDCSQA